MNTQLVYGNLRNLRSKEIVRASAKHPAEFCAVPLDKALELLVKDHQKESQNIERERDEILSQWRSIIMQEQVNAKHTEQKLF